MVLHFWHPHLVKVCQLNLSITLYFKHFHLCMDHLSKFFDNPSYSSREFPMQSTLKRVLTGPNCIDHRVVIYSENFLPKRSSWLLTWSHQELMTMMHDSIHTGSSGYRILRFENRILIPFFVVTPRTSG